MLYCLGVGLIGALIRSARQPTSSAARAADAFVRKSPGAASA